MYHGLGVVDNETFFGSFEIGSRFNKKYVIAGTFNPIRGPPGSKTTLRMHTQPAVQSHRLPSCFHTK
jgi:hypothetical protein